MWAVALVVGLVVAGCTSKQPNRKVPIEDKGSAKGAVVQPSPSAPEAGVARETSSAASLPGAENAGKPGYYMVKPGDTLIRIGLEQGQNWRDIARWNDLSNPNLIEVGQVLRVIPPGAQVHSSGVITSPVGEVPASTPPAASTAPSSTASAAAGAGAASASNSAPPAASDDIPSFIWPASGAILANFDEVKNKGIDIGGKPGDTVMAVADGKVVYAGSGLRGYGNLVIVQHNSTYLSAYAHNQQLMVKEYQMVRKGQKIAEMGSSDTDRVKLHFEVRKNGKPMDPLRYLPQR